MKAKKAIAMKISASVRSVIVLRSRSRLCSSVVYLVYCFWCFERSSCSSSFTASTWRERWRHAQTQPKVRKTRAAKS